MGTLNTKFLLAAENKQEFIKRLITNLLNEYEENELNHLEVTKVVKELKEEGILHYNGRVNKQSPLYSKYVQEKEINIIVNIDRLTKKMIKIFAGKMGSADGQSYMLLNSTIEVAKSLTEFIELYSDVTEEEVIKATEKYLELAPKVGDKYKYAPKVSTFINGSSTKLYLYNYVCLIRDEPRMTSMNQRDGIYRDA
jgi:hypothetical protein